MPRRSTVHLLICALAFVTALALLGLASIVHVSPATDPRDGNTAAVIRGFYGAVNQVLRSGDTAALQAVVDPALVVHGEPPGLTPDRAGLIRHLSGVHAALPGAEILIEELTIVGDRGMARLAVRDDNDGRFLGLRLRGEPLVWGSIDVVTVAGGRIVEVWSDGEILALLEPLSRVPLEPRAGTAQTVGIARLAFPANGDPLPGSSIESRMVYVAAGTITVAVDPTSAVPVTAVIVGDGDDRSWAVMPGTEHLLGRGDAVALPASSRYTLRHRGGVPAPVLVVISFPNDTYTGPLHANGALTPTQHRDDDPPTALPEGGAVVALGRVRLPPGSAVSLDDAAGPVLIVVETGALDLEVSNGTARVDRRVSDRRVNVVRGSHTIGETALLPTGTSLVLRAVGDDPVAALVFAIQPAGIEASSPD